MSRPFARAALAVAVAVAVAAAAAAPGALAECARDDVACAEECFRKFNRLFRRDSFFGTSDPVYDVESRSFVGDALTPDVLMPTGTARTSELVLDKVCDDSASRVVVRYAISYAEALRCMNGRLFDDDATERFHSNGNLDAIFSRRMEQVCAPSARGRCPNVRFATRAAVGDAIDSFAEQTEAVQCDLVDFIGCCSATEVWFDDEEPFNAMSSSVEGAADRDAMNEAISRCSQNNSRAYINTCPLSNRVGFYDRHFVVLRNASSYAFTDANNFRLSVALSRDVAQAVASATETSLADGSYSDKVYPAAIEVREIRRYTSQDAEDAANREGAGADADADTDADADADEDSDDDMYGVDDEDADGSEDASLRPAPLAMAAAAAVPSVESSIVVVFEVNQDFFYGDGRLVSHVLAGPGVSLERVRAAAAGLSDVEDLDDVGAYTVRVDRVNGSESPGSRALASWALLLAGALAALAFPALW